MKALYKIIPSAFLAGALFFAGCDKQKENVGPNAVSQSQDGKSQPTGSYGIKFVSNQFTAEAGSTGYTTFIYQVTPTTSSQDISHFVMTLPCKNPDGNGYRFGPGNIFDVVISSGTAACTSTGLTATQGSGTGCDMSGAENFFKIDGFNCTSRSATSSYTISFKMLGNVGLADGTAWVKFSTSCVALATKVPGCPEATDNGCSMSQGYYFSKPNVVWPTPTVTIGGTTANKAQGQLLFDQYPGGTNPYTAAFYQASAIELSTAAKSYSPLAPNNVNFEVARIKVLLAGIDLVAGVPAEGTDAAKESELEALAGEIGAWISTNHCVTSSTSGL